MGTYAGWLCFKKDTLDRMAEGMTGGGCNMTDEELVHYAWKNGWNNASAKELKVGLAERGVRRNDVDQWSYFEDEDKF